MRLAFWFMALSAFNKMHIRATRTFIGFMSASKRNYSGTFVSLINEPAGDVFLIGPNDTSFTSEWNPTFG